MSFARVSGGLVPCAYCGGPASQVDHVIPVSQGGVNDASNWAASCKYCNAEKRDRTPEQWREWREGQGWCWPPRNPPEGLGKEAFKRFRNGVSEPEEGGSCAKRGCRNHSRVGHETCRWHDPAVLALREEAELARQRALHAAGVAS